MIDNGSITKGELHKHANKQPYLAYTRTADQGKWPKTFEIIIYKVTNSLKALSWFAASSDVGWWSHEAAKVRLRSSEMHLRMGCLRMRQAPCQETLGERDVASEQ